MAQEVLLVPRTAYVPFVAQQPTTPVRLTSSMTVLPPTAPTPTVAAPPPEQPAQQVSAPPPPAKEECSKEMLDLCKKLNQRLDHMERSLHERKPTVCPTPAPHCPTPQPLLPQLFRRPLFHRAEREQVIRCEPAIRCEPGVRCEPSVRCEPFCEQPVFHHTQSMPLDSMPFPGTPVQSTPLPTPIRIVPPENEAIGPPARTTGANSEAGATDMTPMAPAPLPPTPMPPAPLPLPAEPTLPLAPPMAPPMAPVQ
jgi:hypothetical protein